MEAWGLTDTGLVRKQNQDTFELLELGKNQLLAVVCDGMGGAKSGNVASRLAVEVFSRTIRAYYSPDMGLTEAESMLREAVSQSNRALYEQSHLSEDYEGMGTTLVALLITPKLAIAVNVGDSRVYRLNEDGVTRISTDHSLVEMMVQRGELTREQARTHPSKNIITRAIGTESAVECDLYSVDVQEGDFFLLCSDGLSNLIADQEILFEVLHGADREDCCHRLMKMAYERGANDNVTVVLIAC